MTDELFGDKLITEEIDDLGGVLLNNRVLVEVDTFIYNSMGTSSGLSLWVDNTEQVSQYAVRHGRVVKLPQRLISYKERKGGIPWITEIECAVGDVVWFYAMMSFDAEKVSLKGRKFILINYEDLYVAKRGEQVIPLNGNVILKPLFKHLKALSYEYKVMDTSYAEIAYIGTICTEYETQREDDPDLKEGMTVLMSGMPYRSLEKKPYLFFDGENEYIVCQNNEIKGWLE